MISHEKNAIYGNPMLRVVVPPFTVAYSGKHLGLFSLMNVLEERSDGQISGSQYS